MLGAVETFLDAVPTAGFFQGVVLLLVQHSVVDFRLFLQVLYAEQNL